MSWGVVFGKPHLRSRIIPHKKIPPFIGVVVVRSSVHVCSSWRAACGWGLCVLLSFYMSSFITSSSVAAVVYADRRRWSLFGTVSPQISPQSRRFETKCVWNWKHNLSANETSKVQLQLKPEGRHFCSSFPTRARLAHQLLFESDEFQLW